MLFACSAGWRIYFSRTLEQHTSCVVSLSSYDNSIGDIRRAACISPKDGINSHVREAGSESQDDERRVRNKLIPAQPVPALGPQAYDLASHA